MALKKAEKKPVVVPVVTPMRKALLEVMEALRPLCNVDKERIIKTVEVFYDIRGR